jgi:hypothetical protein
MGIDASRSRPPPFPPARCSGEGDENIGDAFVTDNAAGDGRSLTPCTGLATSSTARRPLERWALRRRLGGTNIIPPRSGESSASPPPSTLPAARGGLRDALTPRMPAIERVEEEAG